MMRHPEALKANGFAAYYAHLRHHINITTVLSMDLLNAFFTILDLADQNFADEVDMPDEYVKQSNAYQDVKHFLSKDHLGQSRGTAEMAAGGGAAMIAVQSHGRLEAAGSEHFKGRLDQNRKAAEEAAKAQAALTPPTVGGAEGGVEAKGDGPTVTGQSNTPTTTDNLPTPTEPSLDASQGQPNPESTKPTSDDSSS